MKEYQTFLSEQKVLLEASSKGGKGPAVGEKSFMKGMGHTQKHNVTLQRSTVSQETNVLFKELFYNRVMFNFSTLLKNLPRLWQNLITPSEAKNLKYVWGNMPDGPEKDRVADLMQDVALMPSSNNRDRAFKNVINQIRNQTFAPSVQGTEYKDYTRYNDVYDSEAKRTRRF